MTVTMKKNKPTKVAPNSRKHLREPEAPRNSAVTTQSSRRMLVPSTGDINCTTNEYSTLPVSLAKRSLPESATKHGGTLKVARIEGHTFICISFRVLEVPSSFQVETSAKANSDSKFIASCDTPSAQLKRF